MKTSFTQARLASMLGLVALLGASPVHAQFTAQSPTGNTLPGAVSIVGGIVLDLVGTNNNRVVSQLAASQLYVGYYNGGTPSSFQGNPGTIGIQTGFNSSVVSALGGGIQKAAIRFTLWDGDTASENFDENDNDLLLNGINFGNWTGVNTITHNSTGTVFGTQSGGGFRNNTLDTGFFYTTDVATLSSFYTSLINLGQVTYQVRDSDPYDNYYDFTQGIDASLINVGTGPVITPPVNGAVPEPSTYGMIGAAVLLAGVMLRRRFSKR